MTPYVGRGHSTKRLAVLAVEWNAPASARCATIARWGIGVVPTPVETDTPHTGGRASNFGFADLVDSIELIMLNVASAGDVVFTERIDRFRWQGRMPDLPVAGVFEVRDGTITAHRDCFDDATWHGATGIPLG